MTFGGPSLIASLSSMLGIRPGMNVHVVSPVDGFMEKLLPLPEGVALLDSAKTGIDLTIFFAQKKVELVEKLTALGHGMAVTGSLWVIFPSLAQTSQTPTEDFVRLVALELGLTDTRKLMLGPEWTALRLQWRSRPKLDLPRAEA